MCQNFFSWKLSPAFQTSFEVLCGKFYKKMLVVQFYQTFLNNFIKKQMEEHNSNSNSIPYQSTTRPGELQGNSIFTQSATSLTRGVIKWSFPRAKRFVESELITKDVPMVNLGSTLSKSSTSLGFGKRHSFIPKETPGPSLTHREYPKMTLRNISISSKPGNRQSWDTHKEIPGPGSYDLKRDFIQENKGVRLKSRGALLDPVKEYPGPNYYSPKATAVKKSRFSAIAFGTSKRYDFTKSAGQKFPGPGTYELISAFEKKTRDLKLREEEKKYVLKFN